MTRFNDFISGIREELGLSTALVLVGCLLAQVGLAYGYVFPALASDIMAEMGWTRAEFSFARVPQLAAMAAASPVIGSLVIRHGGRRVLLSAVALLGALFFLLFPRIDNLYTYYALMVAAGLLLTGIGDITVGQIVSQWVNRVRGLALGIVYAGSNLGGLLLVPWIVGLAGRTDWRYALGAMGLIALIFLLPSIAWLVRDRAPQPQITRTSASTENTRLESDRDLNLRAALLTRSFWILAFSLFAFFFYFLALLEHMVLYLTDLGLDREEAVTRYATAIGLGIWSKIGLGLVVDRISDRYSVIVNYAGLAISSLVLLWSPNSALLWVFIISFGFSYAARDVVYPLIVTYCFGLRYMAAIYGALMVALLFGAAGPFFAAAVHDHTGSYDVAFRVFALTNGISLVALGFLRDERECGAQG